MRWVVVCITGFLGVVCWSSFVSAEEIGGIEFPDGAMSFADAVYSYSPGGDIGGTFTDPSEALGVPDRSGYVGSVSLGDGGELILQFTDNSLTTSGDNNPDLHIFECGGEVEWMIISISTDAITWISLGELRGHPTSIDIDGFAGVVQGTRYNYVRIQDDPTRNQTDYPSGEADVDAVGAISTIATPDLIVSSVDITAVESDCQTLNVAGTIIAEVENIGGSETENDFVVVFFEDRDTDGVFDPNIDNVFGWIDESPLAAGDSVIVSCLIDGTIAFRGNLIHVFVDSSNVIIESDETNNITHSGQNCETAPVVGLFDPVVEWNKSTFSIRPESNQVMMTPVVADVNQDGIPDVIFITYGDAYSDGGRGYGVLRVISGDDGSELWSVREDDYETDGYGGLAVGDIDGDERPEIIANHKSGALIAFEDDGSFKWESSTYWTSMNNWGSPSLADLDGDGTVEIIAGASVFNADGTIRWEGNASGGLGRGDNGCGPLSAVADLNLDGSPEIIAGRSAYYADGSLYWNSSIPDGFVGVANFDVDSYPEVVVVASGRVYLLEHTGDVVWGGVSIPGGGQGGAPTIADMDGDGEPEIGVAGASRYVVLETDGSVKWQSPTSDQSSRRTGSSVFDFEGDGRVEVIYGDESYLRIYRGTDGEILYELPKGSGTTYEYPLIVDVDADGNAEIVATANRLGQNGIYVIGDANDTWVSTRQIWNQHTYHITNVNDDATIPIYEENNWELYNNYRLNIQTQGSPLAAPDLTASFLRRFVDRDGAISTGIIARIGNGGANVAAAPIDVAFYDVGLSGGVSLLGIAETTQNLQPGQYEDVILVLDPDVTSTGFISVVADDDGTGMGAVSECNEENNQCYSDLRCSLAVSSTEGGFVTEPGEENFSYFWGSVVSIAAEPNTCYDFTGWTGTAVDANKVTHPQNPNTNVLVDDDYTLIANFEPITYCLDISSSEGGSVIEPPEGEHSYPCGSSVRIVAQADTCSKFIRWSGTAVDAEKVTDPEELETQVLVDGDYTLIANYEQATYCVDISSSEGGSVTKPGEGESCCPCGSFVSIVAEAVTCYSFTHWSGTAVDANKVTDPNNKETEILVDGDYTLVASFVFENYPELSSTDGGVAEIVRDRHWTQCERFYTIEAFPEDCYEFTHWTGSAVDAGKVSEPAANPVAFLADRKYTLKAHFELIEYTLTLSSTDGGSVTQPEEEKLNIYCEPEYVDIVATPDQNYHFTCWSGTAVDEGKVTNPESSTTTVWVDGDYELIANFAHDL